MSTSPYQHEPGNMLKKKNVVSSLNQTSKVGRHSPTLVVRKGAKPGKPSILVMLFGLVELRPKLEEISLKAKQTGQLKKNSSTANSHLNVVQLF